MRSDMTLVSDRLTGRYYDGRRAACDDATVALQAGQLVASPPVFAPVALADVRIASRLGRVPRAVRLPNGGVFETADHEVLDRWQRESGLGRNLAHRLESSLPAVLASLMLLAVVFAAATFWGVPQFARLAAERLPPEVLADAGRHAFEQMDRIVFDASTLDVTRRTKMVVLFASLAPADGPLEYRLEFRDGGALGANAFALPDGTIVVTDQLVAVTTDLDEIAAVLLHEIGHVEGRHSARLVLSHAGLAALTFAVFGDVSAAGALVVALPNLLMESSYSRDMEWDADSYALARMEETGIPRGAFARLLERLPESDGPGFLSTHPPSVWRIARFTEP